MAQTGGQASGETGPEYDWNIPAKFYYIGPEGHHSSDAEPKIIYSDEAPPTDGAAITKLVQQNNLNHGDVLCFDEFRFLDSYIAVRDASDHGFQFVRNPDDSGSGYLTIPEVALVNVTDAWSKYQQIIEDVMENGAVNLHISPRDKFVGDKLGEGIPDDWRFDVCYTGGIEDGVAVQAAGSSEWQEVDLNKVSLDDVKAMLQGDTGDGDDVAKFKVQVSLKGARFTLYKSRFNTESNKYAWLAAKPELPARWNMEKGTSQAGEDFSSWEWRFEGPKRDLTNAKTEVEQFLEGFNFEIKE